MDRILIKNAGFLFAVQVFNLLLPFVTFPYLTRTLGPDNFGAINLAIATATYGLLLAEYGFNLSASRRVAAEKNSVEALSKIFWGVASAKILLGLAASNLIIFVTLLIPQLHAIKYLIWGAMPLIVGAALTPAWFLQGLERMGVTSISILAAQLCVIPLTFLLIKTSEDALVAVIIRCSAPVLSSLGLLAWIFARRDIHIQRPTWQGTKQALSEGWHIFLSSAAINLYTTSNQVILGLICGTTQVGYFAAADRIRAAAQSISGVLSSAAYPRVSALMRSDRVAALRIVKRLALVQCCATFIGGCALWALAPFIVEIVMGPAFHTSAQVLKWMAFVPFVVSVSNVLGVQLMLPLGMAKAFSGILFISAIVNICIFPPLAFKLESVGGGAAMLLTESFVTTAMAIYLWKHFPKHLENQRAPSKV